VQRHQRLNEIDDSRRQAGLVQGVLHLEIVAPQRLVDRAPGGADPLSGWKSRRRVAGGRRLDIGGEELQQVVQPLRRFPGQHRLRDLLDSLRERELESVRARLSARRWRLRRGGRGTSLKCLAHGGVLGRK
jgi:hypothetical protein